MNKYFDKDPSFDCLSYARPCRVVIKYFNSGMPSVLYQHPFSSLSAFDDWRYMPANRNKVVHSLHIMYEYDKDFLSDDGCILK